ncbi:hypothetical protein Brsp01_51960 [Brucella sp. NBRC 12950]|nr:hypothetical protein Brsp01_51960 [Brucella sp. NBRC 12950]
MFGIDQKRRKRTIAGCQTTFGNLTLTPRNFTSTVRSIPASANALADITLTVMWDRVTQYV